MATNAETALQENNDVCPICVLEFVDPVIAVCNHKFCEACVGEWIRKKHLEQQAPTCPICRKMFISGSFEVEFEIKQKIDWDDFPLENDEYFDLLG